MPITEPVNRSPSLDFRSEYASGFSHNREEAYPGYYRVVLANGVTVELSATRRSGVALFRYRQGAARTVLVRTSDSGVGSTARN